MKWAITASKEGTVNVLYAPTDFIALRMMETFERAGYRWMNEVNENTDMGYRMDRVKEG